ncbi:preprotein translocase subunit SecA [Pseudorhodoferax sp.]|uniref:preprotein translocase subunit SecA n=1 Tax=Pseudorhodoferax sp. TaxID=1993553 RepID=UPI002DD67C55|nr:hypothetical protein [Pseudorhodoferax sp.]
MRSAAPPPTRDLGFAAYPQRRVEAEPAPLRDLGRDLLRALGARGAALLQRGRRARWPAAVGRALASTRQRLAPLHDTALAAELPALRARLRRDGLAGAALGEALALVALCCERRLGLAPYPTQLHAAWLLLDGRFAEMATGEGKTLAAGLGAAVAALSGVPVHLLTANDYLVQRDRERLAPVYEALGLRSACVLPAMTREERALAYRADIVLLTARELAFDYLRDHMALAGERDPRVRRALALQRGRAPAQPVLPGLCMALVDEADSVLLDEATMPLILARPAAGVDVGAYRRALQISRTLQRQRDYTLQPRLRRAELTAAGRERVAAALLALPAASLGVLRPTRRAHELVEAALAARLCVRRDRDYAILGDKLQLIDDTTGRIAEGRRWTGPLQAMAEINESLAPSQGNQTAAQITYQRLFPRYLRLGAMSGTLREAAPELRVLYDARVHRVPLARADRRRWCGERLYADGARRDAALVAQVRRLSAAGRPVLVGTDSVAASQGLSALLQAAGVPHQVLNAVQSADEAGLVARAGEAGRVTVATNMAGRGTDIQPDTAALAAGGLHVIAASRNRSRRIDRQLIGRAARHGDPGSAERLLALDDLLLQQGLPGWLRRAAAALAGADGRVPQWLARPLAAAAQWRAEHADSQARRVLRRADSDAQTLYAFAGGTE